MGQSIRTILVALVVQLRLGLGGEHERILQVGEDRHFDDVGGTERVRQPFQSQLGDESTTTGRIVQQHQPCRLFLIVCGGVDDLNERRTFMPFVLGAIIVGDVGNQLGDFCSDLLLGDVGNAGLVLAVYDSH